MMDGMIALPTDVEQDRMVEAILFAATEPLTAAEIEARMPYGSDAAGALRRLSQRYAGRGVELARVGRAYAFRTAGDLGHLMRQEAETSRKLSRAGIETLAIIAYHQPVTRAEIEEIRGVTVSKGTLDLLLELGWASLGPRRQTPGRPATFVTTQAFLDEFALGSVADLPALEELKAAGLLEPAPPVDTPAELSLPLDVAAE